MESYSSLKYNEKSWVGIFLIELLSQKGMIEKGKFDITDVKVDIKINGEDYNFEEVVNHIGHQYQDMVKKDARKLFQEKADDLVLSKLQNIGFYADRLEEEVESYVKELWEK